MDLLGRDKRRRGFFEKMDKKQPASNRHLMLYLFAYGMSVWGESCAYKIDNVN